MKYLIDLGHPAHIHYFKQFIWSVVDLGHEVKLIARDKEVLYQLLNSYNFEFTKRGKGGKSIFSKFLYLFKADYIIFKAALKFRPDVFLSFASPYAAQIAWLTRKPHIAFDDTEHAKFSTFLYAPFSTIIMNPKSFWRKYSKKQLFFDGFMELTHLIPKYFTPSIDVLTMYGISTHEKFYIVRFVSWEASHDIGQTGISLDKKRSVIQLLLNQGRVLISAEGKLPADLEQYRIKINPAHLHDLLYYAQLYIGEGATTAAESIILGTPAIYINSLDAGTISEQAMKYGLISLRNSEDVLIKLGEMLNTDYKSIAQINRAQLLKEKIDVTAFVIWLLTGYPKNFELFKENANTQYQFKIIQA